MKWIKKDIYGSKQVWYSNDIIDKIYKIAEEYDIDEILKIIEKEDKNV